MEPVGERLAPDLGPRGEADKEILDTALEEMDPDLVWVDGQGWMEPADAAGLGGMTLAEMKAAEDEYEARQRLETRNT